MGLKHTPNLIISYYQSLDLSSIMLFFWQQLLENIVFFNHSGAGRVAAKYPLPQHGQWQLLIFNNYGVKRYSHLNSVIFHAAYRRV
jgi:hypothetical protein